MLHTECKNIIKQNCNQPITGCFVASCIVHAIFLAALIIGSGQKIQQLSPQIIQVEINTTVEHQMRLPPPETLQAKTVVPAQEIYKPAVSHQQQKTLPAETSLTSEKQTEKLPVPPSHETPKQNAASPEPVHSVKNEKPVAFVSKQVPTATSESKQKPPVPDDFGRRNYFATIRAAVEQRKEYPILARRKKLEGTVVARFTLSRNGRLHNVEIATSSNESILDNAALNAIKSVQQFPPAPLDVKGENIQIEVPLTYRMAGQ